MVHLMRSRVAISGSIVAIFTIVRVVLDQSAINALQKQADDATSDPGTSANHKPSDGAPQTAASLVLIVGYMRGGTSFVGNLFNQHRGAFYWYEPLDGAYSSLFGTPYGWTPLDITHTLDGEPRRLSNTEEEAIVETLGAIYTCQFGRLPTEVLSHRFVDGTLSKAHSNYAACLRANVPAYTGGAASVASEVPSSAASAASSSSAGCKSLLQSLCPQSFEDPRTYKCYELLHKGLPDTSNTASATTGTTGTTSDGHDVITNSTGGGGGGGGDEAVFTAGQLGRFRSHARCLRRMRGAADACLPPLISRCRQAAAVVVKTVRMRMSTVQLVLRRFPRLRVVHVLREPVPVVLSRYRNKLMSAASGGMVITEAVVMCSKMAADIRRRGRLEFQFSPSNFMALRLEQFAADPLGALAALFRHVGLDGAGAGEADASTSASAAVAAWVREVYRDGGGGRFVPCANFTSGDEEKDEFAMEYCYEGFLQNLRKACVEYYRTINGTWR